jgi:PAS domain S-box-containing protein
MGNTGTGGQMVTSPDETTVDPYAVIAALRAERDAALAEKAELAKALAGRHDGQRTEHQTAMVDIETLRAEIGELRAAQAAGLKVLHSMVASPGHTQPVFDLIARQAADLCVASAAAVAMLDGTTLHLATQYGYDPEFASVYANQFPRPVGSETVMGRAILGHRVEQIEDLGAEPGYGIARAPGRWSTMAVPLLRGGAPLGVIAVGRPTVGRFPENQVTLLQTFAEQAVIAITSAEMNRELQARTTALTQRNSEYSERIEHQSATIDVLKVMSASPGDPQPVFDLIVNRARELSNATSVGLFEYDGKLQWRRANSGGDEATNRRFAALFPMAPTRHVLSGRAILDRQIVHVRDMDAEPGLFRAARDAGNKSLLALPLLRDGEAIGALACNSLKPGGFSGSQVALLQTFAEQAVIAITSAETYLALQTRTADLQETLEYQTAISDVLKVISRSTFDLQPVLDTLVETAARLCDADQAIINRREGAGLRLAANFGFPPEYEEHFRSHGLVSFDAHTVSARAANERHPVHIHDVTTVLGYPEAPINLGKQRTSLGVPLLREDEVIGTIVLARRRVEPFTDRQIELVSTFADQAVIAIENTRLMTEQREALEQQTATAEVLGVINSSPGNLVPVFDAMLEKAMHLCEAAFGILWTYEDGRFHAPALRGVPPAFAEFLRKPLGPFHPGSGLNRVLRGEDLIINEDMSPEEIYQAGDPLRRAIVDLGGARTAVNVSLRKEQTLLGAITVFRQEVRSFSNKQIALLQTFAAQAVIAMENARLLTEQREALEQQTATAEVLQVINANPGNLAPVFDIILEKAHSLCGVTSGALEVWDGIRLRPMATRGLPEQFEALVREGWQPGPNEPIWELHNGATFVHVADQTTIDEPAHRKAAELGFRTFLAVALRKDKKLLGRIVAARQEIRPFSDKEIGLLENFAGQAVVAMENARLLNEIRQRQEELRVTFENMGDGVAMFDETPRLVAWNRNFQQLLDLPDAMLTERPSYADYLRLLGARGEFGAEDVEAEFARRLEDTDRELRLERTRPDGRVIEVRRNAVPDGGFVLIYSDITERKRSEAEIRAARDAAEAAYRDLKAAQANLIQAEKMASLGQLTAGIAHEIKNPLNFVNNFAELSGDLLDELHDAVATNQQAEIDELTATLKGNLAKITEHGKRADGIVRSMLEHSRGSSGERRSVDLNVLVDEALNLAYHGARARDQSFNITLRHDFAERIAPITLVPQDITRVLLNLFSNGFYAARRRQSMEATPGFEPTLNVATRELGDAVEIRVRDNGIGIPEEVKDKLFQPFFTTKPTGEGTGLGLSISYDIVTQQHGGSITVDSKVGEFSEFTILLPRSS